MKPHSMFFDEVYSEHYYRKDTVMNFVEEADCLIVVGTALATNLAKQIVCKLLNKELPVIEINMESSINRGNNIQVLGKSELTLPAMFNHFYSMNGVQRAPAAQPNRAGGAQAAAANPQNNRIANMQRAPIAAAKKKKGAKGAKRGSASNSPKRDNSASRGA